MENGKGGFYFAVLVLFIISLTPAVGNSQAQNSLLNSVVPSLDQSHQEPVVTMVRPGVFDVGGCIINTELQQVEIDAIVNMKEGLLEYLIVSRTGKVHESLLRTNIEPYTLQFALLLAGFEGTRRPLEFQGQPIVPEGDKLMIYINWEEQGKMREIPVEKCILSGNRQLSSIPWVFTGSKVIDGVFMAQLEKSIVAVYHDPMAMIDHQLPEGANDEVWTPASAVLPDVGTKVKVIMKKR